MLIAEHEKDYPKFKSYKDKVHKIKFMENVMIGY